LSKRCIRLCNGNRGMVGCIKGWCSFDITKITFMWLVLDGWEGKEKKMEGINPNWKRLLSYTLYDGVHQLHLTNSSKRKYVTDVWAHPTFNLSNHTKCMLFTLLSV
jgi:hypothetical protein